MKCKYPLYKSVIFFAQRKRQLCLIKLLFFLSSVIVVLGFFSPYLSFFLLIAFIVGIYYFIGFVFFYRLIFHNIALQGDVKKMPTGVIHKASKVFELGQPEPENAAKVEKVLSDILGNESGIVFRDTKTTAFLVIANNKLIYEEYFNDSARSELQLTYSVGKSFLSALIGIAIAEKKITSVNDSLTEYLPELLSVDKKFSEITIQNLLSMSSGIRFRGGHNSLFGDNLRESFGVNFYEDLLKKRRVLIEEAAAKHFWYNNYNTDILVVILEKVYGQKVFNILQEKIWQPMGAEYDACVTLDSRKNSFGKLSYGLQATAIDLAKFAQLFLNNGVWNGEQIIAKDWIEKSTAPLGQAGEIYYQKKSFFSSFFEKEEAYYKYFWWGRGSSDNYNYMARGVNGQFIYISPKKNIAIVRTGNDYGFSPDSWIDIFEKFTNKLSKEAYARK